MRACNIKLSPIPFALAALALAAAGCEFPLQQRQLTVLMAEYHGPDAMPTAQRVGRELMQQGLPDVFIVESPGMASLCAGRYDSWRDNDADAMLKRVRRIRDAQGQFPFAGVMLVPVPEPAPPTPWPLERAKGIFTFHLASWEAPGRMARAQAYAAELRAQGHEAYVYHGPRLSMVTIGGFGPEIFDNPALAGQPGSRPKITAPQVLDLIQKFPRMRLEGEVTPPEAHIPTQLVKIPGRETPVAAGRPLPQVLFRVSLALVDARTGQAEGRFRAAGVAQSREEMPALVAKLVKQLLDAAPAGRPVRVGAAGVAATDADAARLKADALVLEAVTAALAAAGPRVVAVGPEATAQMLDAAGLAPAAVLADPRLLRSAQGFDYAITGSVTSFPR